MAIDATSYYFHFIEKESDMYIHYAKSNFPAKNVVVKKKIILGKNPLCQKLGMKLKSCAVSVVFTKLFVAVTFW